MQLLPTVSLYLSDADCAAMREIAGVYSVDAARWQCALKNAHKRRLDDTLTVVGSLRYETKCKTKNGALIYNRSDCYKLGKMYEEHPARVIERKLESGQVHVTLVYNCLCDILHFAAHGSSPDVDFEPCVGERRLKKWPAYPMDFDDYIETPNRFRSPSNSYQMVEICGYVFKNVHIYSMLLPSEMLAVNDNHYPTRKSKIKRKWRRYLRG
jgi:hypothetical protein